MALGMLFGTRRWSAELESSDPELAEMAGCIVGMLDKDSSRLPSPSVKFELERSEKYCTLHIGGELWSEWPQPELVMADFHWAILEAAFRSSPGTMAFHAGTFELDGWRFMVPGFSGHGKSSLVMAACQQGALFGGDDLTWLDLDDGSIIPFPMAMVLSDDGLAQFGDDLSGAFFLSALVEMEDKTECRNYFDPAHFSSKIMDSGPLSSVILRHPPFDEEGRLERLDPGDALIELYRHTQFIWDEKIEVFQQMVAVAGEVPVFSAAGCKEDLIELLKEMIHYENN